MASAVAWLVILRASAAAAAAAREQSMASEIVGGFSPIHDINNPGVTEMANFAVTEYNKRSKANLKFEKVIKGESQVVAGTNFHLTLSASEGSISKNYEAYVWDQPWTHFRNLTSFVPVRS